MPMRDGTAGGLAEHPSSVHTAVVKWYGRRKEKSDANCSCQGWRLAKRASRHVRLAFCEAKQHQAYVLKRIRKGHCGETSG